MEQIIVTRRDGTTYPLAVKSQAVSIKEARQSWGLLGDDVVNITVESPYPQNYEIGDHFNVFGRDYKLNQLPRMRKSGEHKYTYELTFEGVQYDLLRAFYDVTIETTGNTLQDVQGDSLTGNLNRFATVLVSNANRVFPGKWELGNCPDTVADKTLTFGDGDNCLAVFQNLCKSFEVEADITQSNGIHTINFYTRVGQTHPYVFEFGKGKGLYALDRQNVDSSNVVTRLKVYGSSENITNKYRANRLCLPGKSKAQSFIEQEEAVQKYGIHEARKIFEDIKPTFNGKVTAIVDGNVTQFKDESMFDLNAKEADGKTTKYLVAGVNAKIHFNTGKLAGYEFEINASKGGYDHATHTFTLKPIKNEVIGYAFPDAEHPEFQIANGDEYKILDITLPEQYQTEAEHKLQEQGNEYYRQNSQPKVKYGLSVSPSFIYKMFGTDVTGTLFAPGDYIQIKDDEIGVDKAIRIQSLQRSLLDVYDYSLTISDSAENNITTRVISELIDIDKIVTTNNLKDPVRAKANWRTTREVLDMVFDPDGDYYTDKIKPSSIDTLALSVGAKSMQFALQDVVFEPNYQGNKNTVRVSAGTLTHYAIEEQVRTWMLPSITIDLYNDAQAYYIYAKCSRENNSGTILFSIDQIKVDQGPNDYHFWIGVINSVDPTLQARIVSLTYGATTVNGKFIRTGRINSSDGLCFFDLDGNRFRVGDNAHGLSWNENGDGRLLLKGTLVQSLGGETSEIGVYRGPWSSSATYYKGDEVSYTGSFETCTYRYINDSPSSNKRPSGYVSYWTVVARGRKGDKGDKGDAGLQGLQGPKGDRGIPGTPGANGKSSYTHIAYADTPNGGGFSQNPSGKAYIGMYVDDNPTDSTNPAKYKWSKIKGEQGLKGDQGIPGASGSDGRTTFLHIAYADTSSGGGFSQNPSGKKYIGTYTDFVQADSSDPGRYKWSLIKGADGSGVYLAYKNSDTKPAKPTQTEQEKKTQTTPSGWYSEPEDTPSATHGISNIRYSGSWVKQTSGINKDFYKSNSIAHNGFTKMRIMFDAEAGAELDIALIASSEANYDVLAISEVNKAINSASDYENSSVIKAKISGEKGTRAKYQFQSELKNAFIDFAYKKDGSGSKYDDAGYFSVSEPQSSVWWQSSARQEFAADGTWTMSDWTEPVQITGKDGKDGDKGDKGDKGDSPVCVFCGEYKSGITYYGNPTRRDIVKYSETYYIANIDAGAFSSVTPSSTSSKWENFGAQFSSVATELLLAENANIGDWFLSGGKIVSTLDKKNNNGVITLDARASKVEIRNKANGQDQAFLKGDIDISSKDGSIVISSEYNLLGQQKSKLDISHRGISTNHAGTSVYLCGSSMPSSLSAISVEAQSTLDISTWQKIEEYEGDPRGRIVAGVFSQVSNSGNAPSYGAYFRQLKAAGISYSVQVVNNTGVTKIKDNISYVLGMTSTSGEYYVGLPLSNRSGQTIIVKNQNGGAMHVQTWSSVKIRERFLNDLTTFPLSVGEAAIFTLVQMNDGRWYWIAKRI